MGMLRNVFPSALCMPLFAFHCNIANCNALTMQMTTEADHRGFVLYFFFQWDTRVLMLIVAIYLHLYLSSTPDRWGVKSIKCALICACICTCECLHVQLKLTKWKKVIANKNVSMCAIMSVVSLFKSTFSFCAWLCVCRWGCARMSACRGENGLDFSV